MDLSLPITSLVCMLCGLGVEGERGGGGGGDVETLV